MRCKKCDLNKFSDTDLCNECEKDIIAQRDDEEIERFKIQLEGD